MLSQKFWVDIAEPFLDFAQTHPIVTCEADAGERRLLNPIVHSVTSEPVEFRDGLRIYVFLSQVLVQMCFLRFHWISVE